MSNKSRLQANNTNLQALIAKANTLPNAGGGGGSTETITITITGFPDPGMEIWYLDGTMTLCQEEISKGSSFTIMKGTLLVVTSCTTSSWMGLTHIGGNAIYRAFLATEEQGGASGGAGS